MYRILLAISGREDSERSGSIADALMSIPMDTEEVAVTILSVFEEFDATDDGATISSEALYEGSNVPEPVQQTETQLAEHGIAVDVIREHGDPTKEIINTTDEIDADLIVMGGRKQTPVGKVIFGSTTQAVMLKSERPVLVMMDAWRRATRDNISAD